MKKYNITFLKRFKANNGKDYVSMELQSQKPSVSKEGVMLGYHTYPIIASAEKVPATYVFGGVVECCLSFDKETGRPFAYNFVEPKSEEPVVNQPETDDDISF